MIDLTKPIRRKGETKEFRIGCEPYYQVIEVGDLCWSSLLSREQIEDHYENIPEPRKPREWWLEFCGKEVKSIYDSHYQGKTRVIEWPEHAPLPDWPEGEGS